MSASDNKDTVDKEYMRKDIKLKYTIKTPPMDGVLKKTDSQKKK